MIPVLTLIALLYPQSIYRGMDQAAIAALGEAAICSENRRECGGVIYQTPIGYVYSPPFTSNLPFGGQIPDLAKPPPYADWKLVADYHVHICNKRNKEFANYFSPADAYVNQGFHIVGYMLSLCDHNIHRYDPSQDDRDDEEVDFKPHRDGSRHKPIYLTIGHIIGWIAPERI